MNTLNLLPQNYLKLFSEVLEPLEKFKTVKTSALKHISNQIHKFKIQNSLLKDFFKATFKLLSF